MERLDRVDTTGGRFIGEQVPIRLQPSPEVAARELLLDFIYEAITDPVTRMWPEARARAFEPFFTTKPVGHGSGLALARRRAQQKAHA